MPRVNREAPKETHIQSVLFPKDEWTKEESEKWLKDHDFYTDGFDESEKFYRWRQYDPSDDFEYRNEEHKSENKKFYFVYGFLKKNEKKGEVKMEMKKQGIFFRKLEDKKEVAIDIVGVIGWDVWYPQLKDMLEKIEDGIESVIFNIYSPGGDIWEGNAIVNQIASLKQKTVARVQVAASMATIIALACQKRIMAANGRWLVHNPWTIVQGDAEVMEKRAKELRDCEQEAAEFYAKRTGKTKEEMLKLMSEERWLTAKEAKEFGFIDEIENPFNEAEFANVKAELEAKGLFPKALINEDQKQDVVEEKKEVKNENSTAEFSEASGETNVKQSSPSSNASGEDQKANDGEGAFERGVAAGKALAERERAEELKNLQAQIESRNKLIREFQSAKDKLEAELKKEIEAHKVECKKLQNEIENLRASLAEANNRLCKLLNGALAFSPDTDEVHSISPNTWEEALKACNGDYVKARRLYPQVWSHIMNKK